MSSGFKDDGTIDCSGTIVCSSIIICSSIVASFGLLSLMDDEGLGVRSNTSSTGLSVESTFQQ